ncbi:unnamed protein product [Rhodiola kirilowii]
MVSDYNSELFRIVSTIHDKDMLEKTVSTFHASNLVLQQQYKERGFKTYFELLSCLILAEENNQLLLNNHQTRPTGSTPLPNQSNQMAEANATLSRRGNTRGCGRGRNGGRDELRHNYTWINPDIQKNVGNKHKKQTQREESKSQIKTSCYRCGDVGHWSHTCRVAPRHVKLYQDSLKGKEKMLKLISLKLAIQKSTTLRQMIFSSKLKQIGNCLTMV